MRKNVRRLIVIVLVLALSLSGASVAFAGTGSSPQATSDQGIKVQYNGELIAFSDAAPMLVQGRTMVPFRQILETMGALVSYEPAGKTVRAVKGDLEFSFAIGGTDLMITKGGKTAAKKMDVAPYLDPKTGRTFVPARFMAEAMDYSVSWDQAAKTAVIIDPDTLFADADKDFSIIAKLMATNLDPAKAYETTGTFQADFSGLAGLLGASGMNFSIFGDMTGIQQGLDAEMDMNLSMNLDKVLESLSPEERAELEPLLQMFREIRMKIKMEGEGGEMLLSSNLFSLIDPAVDANTWYRMNLYETYDQMGVDIRELMNMSFEEPSVSTLLKAYLPTMAAGGVNSYKDMKLGYALMKNLFGNDAFTTTSSGSVTTHKLKLDKAHILSAIAKTAVSEALWADPAMLSELAGFPDSMELLADIVIREKEGKLYDYDFNGSFSFEDIKFSMLLRGDPLKSKVEMTIDQPDMIKMSIQADSSYWETAKTPNLTLSEGAKVLDYPLSPVMYPVQ